jgi:hypothetical protein
MRPLAVASERVKKFGHDRSLTVTARSVIGAASPLPSRDRKGAVMAGLFHSFRGAL